MNKPEEKEPRINTEYIFFKTIKNKKIKIKNKLIIDGKVSKNPSKFEK